MSNLLANPDFELSSPPALSPNWSGQSVTTVNDNTKSYTGNNYVSFPSSGFKLLSYRGVSVEYGKSYIMSLWINPLTLPKSINVIITGTGGVSQTIILSNANTYTEYIVNYTPVETATVDILFFARIGASLYLDSVSLKENIITNADFDLATPPYLPTNWYSKYVTTVYDAVNTHSGVQYASMTPITTNFALMTHKISGITVSNNYDFSFWANPNNSAKPIVVFSWDFGEEIMMSNLNTWTEYTINFTAVNDPTVIFFMTFYDATDNETRIDDISITEV